jgi:hypothetical protein
MVELFHEEWKREGKSSGNAQKEVPEFSSEPGKARSPLFRNLEVDPGCDSP